MIKLIERRLPHRKKKQGEIKAAKKFPTRAGVDNLGPSAERQETSFSNYRIRSFPAEADLTRRAKSRQ